MASYVRQPPWSRMKPTSKARMDDQPWLYDPCTLANLPTSSDNSHLYTTPVTGDLVYVTDLECYAVYNGSAWQTMDGIPLNGPSSGVEWTQFLDDFLGDSLSPLWNVEFKCDGNKLNTPDPVVSGDKIFITSGAGGPRAGDGCFLLTATNNSATRVYTNTHMCSQIAGPVLVGGFLYGFTGYVSRKGLVCWRTS